MFWISATAFWWGSLVMEQLVDSWSPGQQWPSELWLASSINQCVLSTSSCASMILVMLDPSTAFVVCGDPSHQPFFARPKLVDMVAVSTGRGGGVFYGHGLTLATHAIGILCIIAWSGLWALATFGTMTLIDRGKTENAFFFIRSTAIPGKMLSFFRSQSQMISTDGLGTNGSRPIPDNNIQDDFKKTQIELDQMN